MAPGGTTSVLIVDDHSLYREGLVALFEKWDDVDVVGDAADGIEAVEFCRHRAPDIVLMDLKMPNLDGIEATRIVTAENPGTSVVVLSVFAEEQDVMAAIRSGACGYLLKNTHARQLHGHLRSIVKGHGALSDEVSALCLGYIRKLPREQAPREAMAQGQALTEHETQLIRLLAMGYSNRDIGERLFIGEGTVKKQVSAVLTKLGLENRVQAAVYALRSGIAE